MKSKKNIMSKIRYKIVITDIYINKKLIIICCAFRIRVESMEKKLADLTGLVHTALSKGSLSPLEDPGSEGVEINFSMEPLQVPPRPFGYRSCSPSIQSHPSLATDYRSQGSCKSSVNVSTCLQEWSETHQCSITN